MPENDGLSPGRKLGRALGLGAGYGCGYFALELASAWAVLAKAGMLKAPFALLVPQLTLLVVEYALFGAVCGALTAWPLGALRRKFDNRWTRMRLLDLLSIAGLFSALAWGWNPESVLPRFSYPLYALFTALLLAPAIALGRWLLVRGLSTPRRRIAAGAVVLTGILAAGGAQILRTATAVPDRPAAAPADSPNVVLIVVDALRRNNVSAYGYERPTTPNIDRIAAEGVLFERAYAPDSWTVPTHASLFTGLFSREHQAHGLHPFLEPANRTLAETLSGHGYRSGGFTANPWVSSATGLDQGFERLDYVGIESTVGIFLLNVAKRRFAETDLGAAAVTDSLLRWVEDAAGAGEPFFAFANFMETHEPYGTVPEPYFSAFGPGDLDRNIGRKWVHDTARFPGRECEPAEVEGMRLVDGRWKVTPERLAAVTALYDAGLLYVDHHIGLIYQRLVDLGLVDRTLFIVTSDHGESLGERGQLGHGVTLHDSLLSVPLVMRFPPVFPAGTRNPAPVNLIDVAPTVEQIVGLPVTEHVFGRSLVDTAHADRTAMFAEHFPLGDSRVIMRLERWLRCDLSDLTRASVSAQQGFDKYIRFDDGRVELYDLSTDPAEERDIRAARPETEARLAGLLDEWLSTLKLGEITTDAPLFDPELKKKLEALGYVQ